MQTADLHVRLGVDTNSECFITSEIYFATYIQVDKSEIKPPGFGHVSGDFESGS